MDAIEAIRARQSTKAFADRPVDRATVERLLDLAVLAPNHRMTEPWGFVVLGPKAKRRYAEIRARFRTERIEDAALAESKRARIVDEVMAVPAIIAVTSRIDPEPAVREEDYAATFMAIQNLSIAATALGLGTHIRTGRLLDDPELRVELGIARDDRLAALVYLGEPAGEPRDRQRTPAADRTRWLD